MTISFQSRPNKNTAKKPYSKQFLSSFRIEEKDLLFVVGGIGMAIYLGITDLALLVTILASFAVAGSLYFISACLPLVSKKLNFRISIWHLLTVVCGLTLAFSSFEPSHALFLTGLEDAVNGLVTSGGVGSINTAQIATLIDWLKFCTKEKLNLRNFEELDRQAINQIQTQITTLLSSGLGNTVGRPSTFDPQSRIKFFTIVNLDSERDQVLIAQTIQSTCVRLALQHPKSLIVGDEIADLLKKGGFAQTWGAMHAMARKSGISLLTISQNIEEIQKCTAAADILKNISFKLVGRITTDGATSLVEALKYPDLVYENSTKAFKTDKEKGCSHWLLEIQNQFWQTRFYPSPSNLAMVANGSNEVRVRTQIMNDAIANQTSRWEALEQYAKAIMSG